VGMNRRRWTWRAAGFVCLLIGVLGVLALCLSRLQRRIDGFQTLETWALVPDLDQVYPGRFLHVYKFEQRLTDIRALFGLSFEDAVHLDRRRDSGPTWVIGPDLKPT
jgi:hypothetical protein